MSLPPVERSLIKEDHLREWKNGNPSFKLPEPVPMLRFLYELCSTMVRGELPFQKCRAALDSVEFSEKVSEQELASSLADIVTQMSQDLTMPGEHRARLTKLAKWLVESSLVPLRLFQERCEEEFLWEAEMIKIKAQELKSKEVRVNTRLLYQQTKFNLLREESEGYAKLVTLLCQNSENSSHNAGATIGIIKSLIGHFDLDPNHVFDIVLECFELLPDNNVFLELIPIFPKSHASQILGFKFQHYQRLEVNDPVPFGLYKLTALLVKENFIDLDSICAHLLPKDDEAFEHYSSFSSKQLDEANKIGKINLAATGKDLMEDEKQGDVTIDLFASLDMDSEAVGERSAEFENNQTLGLLTGFLSVDDWYHAHVLFDRLSPLNPVEHIQICNSLFRLIEKSISSAYDMVRQARLNNLGSSSGTSVGVMTTENSSASGSFIELKKELFQMLAIVGPYLYRDTLLLQKVCRVLRGYYLSAPDLGRTGEVAVSASNPRLPLKEARSPRQVAMSRVEEAFRTCLLPSLQLVPANPAVGMEIWEVMSLLPYEVRYRLYGEWEKEDERIPMVLAARQTAKLDTRRILKRLAKENLKQQGRMVAKLAHANPMTVLRTIVHQIEAYKDMIAPVVDAFKYLTQLEYDVLEYVVIERLAQGGRDKLKDDGLNLSDWLQSLASFWGHLCKKYPSMELRGLFQYLVNQLKKGQGIELVVLQELIQQMANVHHTEDLTEDQLDAMAGGETLRHHATGFGVTRHNKQLLKSTNRLRDSLLPKDETKLAIPLLLHLAQHRSLVIIDADAPYIKMVSEQFDRCHGALLQYVEFLCSAMPSASAYAQLIPSLDDLVHKYHLDPEVAFLIYRPVMRLFKSPASSDVFWPLDNNDAQSITSANSESEAVQNSGNVVLDLGSTWNPITWLDLLHTAKAMLPARAWNSLSPDLYATFWGLTLYDLYVPRNCYESEIAKQQASLKVLEEQPDNSISAITKRKKEKERIQDTIDRLTSELRKHEEHVASVRKRLSREKDKWLSSCLDTLKINMEFLQRCIFPRCTFSMPDAVYCAMFVHTLHSLGTPFFNTVNHMDVLICRTLQPMICCCTESEVGRLGKFLCETLKIAYYWKSDESIYERECGNMPGFAVYYRFPDSQRVRYGQFVKVHWKWSQRITRLLGQCLESPEYMEIRNALIILSRISSVFPVTKKSGMNLERRVSKIKGDGREDLKVLATSVGASLAARKPSLVSDEEFCMGYVELKSTASSKPSASNSGAIQSGPAVNNSQTEPVGGRAGNLVSQHSELINSARDHVSKTKPADGRLERAESISTAKSDQGHLKLKGASLVNGSDAQASVPSATLQSGTSRPIENQVQVNEISNRTPDENMGKLAAKNTSESELRAQAKRSVPAGAKPLKQDLAKDESRSGKAAGATNASSITANGSTVSSSGKGSASLGIESKVEAGSAKFSNTRIPSSKEEGAEVSDAARPPSSRFVHSPRHDSSATLSKSSDKLQKRTSPAEETDRQSKRRTYIRHWLHERTGFESDFIILFYPGKFSLDKRSILAVGDISEIIPNEKADIAILEEPEHLTWYHHGKRWKIKFGLVIGIIHTNYLEYVRREKNGRMQAFLLKYVNNWVVGIYCHKVIRLSAATQEYPQSIICNVHGVNPKFLEIGKKKLEQQQNGSQAFSKGAYYIGKMVWNKGYKELLKLLQDHQKELAGLEVDLYGTGEDSDQVREAAEKLELAVRVHPGRDHADLEFHDYKVFLNPSTTDVVCTTTAEALAMGKIVVCANHPSNDFFKQFPNCRTYDNGDGFVKLTQQALAEQPAQLTEAQRYELSWAAATERFLRCAELEKASTAKLSESPSKNFMSTSLNLGGKMETASAYVHHVSSGFEVTRRIFGAIPRSLQPDEEQCKELGLAVPAGKQGSGK